MKKILLLVLLLIVTGCVEEGVPKDRPTALTEPQTPHPQYQEVDIFSIAQIKESTLSGFFPQNITISRYAENITLLPVRTIPLSLENEISQLDPLLRLNYISKEGYWYVEPSKKTRVVVEFGVYEFPSPENVSQIFNLYKINWNNLNWSFDGRDIWVWEGWRAQVVNPNAAIKFRTGTFCTWNPESELLLFSGEGQFSPYVIATPQTDLLCLHGELGRGRYFFMIDIHASPAIIDDVAKGIFSEVLPLIYNATINATGYTSIEEKNDSAMVTANVSTIVSEADELRQRLYKLMDLWLDGNITKDEFDKLSLIYKDRLEKIEANSSVS